MERLKHSQELKDKIRGEFSKKKKAAEATQTSLVTNCESAGAGLRPCDPLMPGHCPPAAAVEPRPEGPSATAPGRASLHRNSESRRSG